MWIFNNWLYKIVALLVAFILWSISQGIKSVEATLDVPISVSNLSPDLVVVRQSHLRLSYVRVRGSRAAVRWAQKDQMHYVLSLDGIKAGAHNMPVTRDRFMLQRGNVEILDHSPDTITFEVEPVITKRVPVKANLVGSPTAGFRVAAVVVDPPEVEIAGARSEVRGLREIATDRVELADLSQTLRTQVPLIPATEHVWRSGEGEAERGAPVTVEVRIEAERTLPPGSVEGVEP